MNSTTDNWKAVETASRKALPADLAKKIETLRKSPHPEGHLIAVLHKVQEHFGYLGREQLDAVAQLLQVPAATVTGVASFYHFFRLTPRGRYVIHVCMGTACYVKGADAIAAKLKAELGIDFGETSKDGIFSLEVSRCLGTCGLAPVIMVGEEVHAAVTPDKIPALLEHYIELARRKPEPQAVASAK